MPFLRAQSRTRARSSASWSRASPRLAQGSVAISSTACISSGLTSPTPSPISARITSIPWASRWVPGSISISSSSMPMVNGVPENLCSMTSPVRMPRIPAIVTAPSAPVCRGRCHTHGETVFEEEARRGSEEPHRAEVPARDPGAGEARPPAQDAVRVRPRPGDAAAAADRQGIEHRPRGFFPNPDSKNPDYQFRLAAEAGYSAIACQIGLATKYFPDYAGQVPLILKVNGKTDVPPSDRALSTCNATPEDAARLGADAVGYTLYVGSPRQDEDLVQLRDVRR